MSKKKIVVAVLILGVLGTGAYYAQKKPQVSPASSTASTTASGDAKKISQKLLASTTVAEIPTAGWMHATYADLVFLYPEEWKPIQSDGGATACARPHIAIVHDIEGARPGMQIEETPFPPEQLADAGYLGDGLQKLGQKYFQYLHATATAYSYQKTKTYYTGFTFGTASGSVLVSTWIPQVAGKPLDKEGDKAQLILRAMLNHIEVASSTNAEALFTTTKRYIGANYTSDVQGVYYYRRLLVGADRESITALFSGSLPSGGRADIARDDSAIYANGMKAPIKVPSTFQVLGDGRFARDSGSVYQLVGGADTKSACPQLDTQPNYKELKGVDPDTFKPPVKSTTDATASDTSRAVSG